jgi:hypothetical protein
LFSPCIAVAVATAAVPVALDQPIARTCRVLSTFRAACSTAIDVCRATIRASAVGLGTGVIVLAGVAVAVGLPAVGLASGAAACAVWLSDKTALPAANMPTQDKAKTVRKAIVILDIFNPVGRFSAGGVCLRHDAPFAGVV